MLRQEAGLSPDREGRRNSYVSGFLAFLNAQCCLQLCTDD